jgi:DNA-binding CsgD family transcriptional regulator
MRTFTGLGALPWVERAAAELRATGARVDAVPAGGPAGGPGGGPAGGLTPQELQVATLAAGGLTNREIGQRLSISPRTVGIHLYRAFPKLGVATRAGLRDALDALDGPPPGAGAPPGRLGASVPLA